MTDVDQTAIARLIAFFLPQFHPIAENNAWWGAGFTEWTNVTRARPWFRGHYQPQLPADLGFYDLRLAETRQAQAQMARAYGVHGFCYYHYWFGGRRIMERPVHEMLLAGEPDFPFCLCWANGHFTRAWDGRASEMLLEQVYSPEDDREHLRALLPIFADPRYIRIDGRPLFLVYSAASLPNARATTDRWREEARRVANLELCLARVESYHDPQATDPRPLGFDVAVAFHPSGYVGVNPMFKTRRYAPLRRTRLLNSAYGHSSIYDYPAYAAAAAHQSVTSYPRFPCVMPGWDNSPRRKTGATIFLRSSPEAYGDWLAAAARDARAAAGDVVPAAETPVVFVNAWNEWAEGAHLEPDQRWGKAYLESTRAALMRAAVEK